MDNPIRSLKLEIDFYDPFWDIHARETHNSGASDRRGAVGRDQPFEPEHGSADILTRGAEDKHRSDTDGTTTFRGNPGVGGYGAEPGGIPLHRTYSPFETLERILDLATEPSRHHGKDGRALLDRIEKLAADALPPRERNTGHYPGAERDRTGR
jgi:hypothetical protein